jgi:DNA end-binding protein Ku
MASRPFWKGYLKLSLVTCPVAMTPATTETEKVRFHTLNRATGARVVSRYVDAESGKPLEEGEAAKGYQRGEDDYILLEDEELEAVRLESTRTIDVDMFVPAESIDWIWYDKAHYLTPDDPVGEEAFSVIRDAMQATGMVGVSRVVLYRPSCSSPATRALCSGRCATATKSAIRNNVSTRSPRSGPIPSSWNSWRP